MQVKLKVLMKTFNEAFRTLESIKKNAGKTEKEIEASFEKPTEMSVFAWKEWKSI